MAGFAILYSVLQHNIFLKRLSEAERAGVLQSKTSEAETECEIHAGNFDTCAEKVYYAAMQYWLMKTEPSTFSWSDLENDFKRRGWTEWDGVRNYEARNNMREMKQGDLVFIYHSVGKLEIVGVAQVYHEIHHDSTDKSRTWQCVDVIPIKKLARSISLEEVKQQRELDSSALVNRGRLSVQPVTAAEWAYILKLSETLV